MNHDMNRRCFFLGAAAAAGSRRTAAASDRVRLAMIGLGGRGRALIRSLGKVPGVEIGWLCEVDQANLERATRQMAEAGLKGRPQTGPDMRKLLEDKSVDAVVIATPDHWHAPAAILAADAGKDVYVEKPCSHNVREGRLMLEAARRNRRVMQVGTQSRSRPSTIQAMEYASSGKIGKVLAAKAWNVQLRKNLGHKPDGPVPPGVDYDTWVGPAPWVPFNENRFHYNWHWHWNFGTGDIGNDGAHQIDQARWALGVGAPVKVSGMGAKIFFDDDQQTPDTMNITYEYGDNRVLIWEMRIWNPYGLENSDNAISIYGTEGMLQVGEWDRKWGFKVFDRGGKLALHEVEKEGDRHLENFVECVRSRQRPSADIEIGHISTLHCHLGNIVARTGRNVRFDARTETIPGDAEANALLRRTYREHWGTPRGV